MAILRAYKNRTKGLRKAVYIYSSIQAVSWTDQTTQPCSTIYSGKMAQIDNEKTGIDASMFKAHSARGAEVTVATNDHLHVT